MHLKAQNSFSFFLCLVALLSVGSTFANPAARDTLKVSGREAEALFLKNNYELILKQYDIERAKAEEITAGLFDNPELSYENLVYNPDTKKFFQTSSADGQGQFNVQYSQLIRLAGKRNKAIRLAGVGLKLSEFEFADLLRTLRFSLRSNLCSLYFLQQSASIYDQEIRSLQKTLEVFNVQLSKGNIAEKEVLRVKSLIIAIQSEYASLQNNIDDLQAELKMLTGLPSNAVLWVESPGAVITADAQLQLSYQQLLESALKNRPDLKAAKAGNEYAALNLKLQKANAVPDMTIFGTYDRQGSHVKHYTGLGLSVPIPLFSRNQGLITEAKANLGASENLVKSKIASIEIELSNTYHATLRLRDLYENIRADADTDFNRLISELNSNYEKRNLGMLEFLDLYNSYRESFLRINQLKADYLNSLEQLNYVTGSSTLDTSH